MIAVHHFLFYRTPPLDPGPKGFTVKQGEHTETFRLTIRFVTENFNDFQLSHRLVTPTDELKCKHSLIRSDPTRCFGPHRSHVSVLMSNIHTMRNKFSRGVESSVCWSCWTETNEPDLRDHRRSDTYWLVLSAETDVFQLELMSDDIFIILLIIDIQTRGPLSLPHPELLWWTEPAQVSSCDLSPDFSRATAGGRTWGDGTARLLTAGGPSESSADRMDVNELRSHWISSSGCKTSVNSADSPRWSPF